MQLQSLIADSKNTSGAICSEGKKNKLFKNALMGAVPRTVDFLETIKKSFGIKE